MSEPAKKPKDAREHSVLKPVAQIASDVVESMAQTGAPPTLDHLAELHGLGLLSELAQLGVQLIDRPCPAPAAGVETGPHPVDPRRQVDPRKRFLPR